MLYRVITLISISFLNGFDLSSKKAKLMELPPGFRFHPTDEELITHYLSKKVLDEAFSAIAIGEVDLNRCEPWDLPWRGGRMGEKEWYFFSVRDRKYPTGLRTNRATESGYWKATGKDKEIHRPAVKSTLLVGMKKTLVFYRGRAPKGHKTNWVMHEYRLEGKYTRVYDLPTSALFKQREWVICRVFKKGSSSDVEVTAAAAASSICNTMGLINHGSCSAASYNYNESSRELEYHLGGDTRTTTSTNKDDDDEEGNRPLLPPLMDATVISPNCKVDRRNRSASEPPEAHVTCFSSITASEDEKGPNEGDCFNNNPLVFHYSSASSNFLHSVFNSFKMMNSTPPTSGLLENSNTSFIPDPDPNPNSSLKQLLQSNLYGAATMEHKHCKTTDCCKDVLSTLSPETAPNS